MQKGREDQNSEREALCHSLAWQRGVMVCTFISVLTSRPVLATLKHLLLFLWHTHLLYLHCRREKYKGTFPIACAIQYTKQITIYGAHAQHRVDVRQKWKSLRLQMNSDLFPARFLSSNSDVNINLGPPLLFSSDLVNCLAEA